MLLDTHTLLWFYSGDGQLSVRVKNEILNLSNVCFISIASLWEITIKVNLGKLQLESPLPDLFNFIDRNEIDILPIELSHLLQLNNLPDYHKDPFDRIIIAQSIADHIPLASKDRFFEKYGVNLIS